MFRIDDNGRARFAVEISKNELVDRLRVIESNLHDENSHSEALFVGMAIQVITELFDEARLAPSAKATS